MGLAKVLRLPQVSPKDIRLGIDYDKWPPRDTDGGQVFVHYVGSKVPSEVAAGEKQAEIAHLRGIESYHAKNGYSGIAYDWAIGNSGVLYRLRGRARSAATSGDVDVDGLSNNAEGDAVLLLVGAGQQPGPRALATLHEVLDAFGRPVFTHREAKGTITACPGDPIQRWVQRYRNGSLEGREHRKVAISAHREPDREWARMVAHAHAFAYVEQGVTNWTQFYPDGAVLKVHEIDYLVAVGFEARSLVNDVGDGVAITGKDGDETRMKVLELIMDDDVPRERPWKDK